MTFIEVTASGAILAAMTGFAWAAWADPETYDWLFQRAMVALTVIVVGWLVYFFARQSTWYEVSDLAREAAHAEGFALSLPGYDVWFSLWGLIGLMSSYVFLMVLSGVSKARLSKQDRSQ